MISACFTVKHYFITYSPYPLDSPNRKMDTFNNRIYSWGCVLVQFLPCASSLDFNISWNYVGPYNKKSWADWSEFSVGCFVWKIDYLRSLPTRIILILKLKSHYGMESCIWEILTISVFKCWNTVFAWILWLFTSVT